MKIKEKAINFYNAITNVYRDEENQRVLQEMKLSNEDLTEDFIALILALNIFYDNATGEQTEIIDFTHILNRLAVQHLLEKQVKPTEKGGVE